MPIAQQSIAQQIADSGPVMQRPIHRLPVRKLSNDSKEAMNCKSCRKRKIKCNRLKPSCEACQVFNSTCVYDAVPKKRGPKTDVLEALLKRVNGLEKRLKDEQRSISPKREGAPPPIDTVASSSHDDSDSPMQEPIPRVSSHTRTDFIPDQRLPEASAFTDVLLDTYFSCLHNKPFYILDESATRLRFRDGRLPPFLVDAIHAVTIKYAPHLYGGQEGARQSSHACMDRARAQIDVDEPTVENLQALLLLATANFQNGRGKKSQMILNHAVSMALALNLHLELPAELQIAVFEREGRRKLFWTCYLMDRFSVSGSKRPTMIADESIHLRLPAWQPPGSRVLVDGPYFTNGSNLSYTTGASNAAQGGGAMLIEIVRMLGITNRYLGAGGVKGDSHFPWHSQSTLSRIRSELDSWAAATREIFTSVDAIFGSQDSSVLVLSKLIYHLIHCLIYRPFLPIELSELSGTGQSQSWQIEATHLCFLHANAIGELCQIASHSTTLTDWPSFVGYCICTAGTIHIHGTHYVSYPQSDTYRQSGEYLSRGMAHLLELRSIYAGLQHHRDTLTAAFNSHADLVRTASSNPARFPPAFQMEDFFDRYPDSYIDGSHVTFSELVIPEDAQEALPIYNQFEQASDLWTGRSVPLHSRTSTNPSQSTMQEPSRPESTQPLIEEEAMIPTPLTSHSHLDSDYVARGLGLEGLPIEFLSTHNFGSAQLGSGLGLNTAVHHNGSFTTYDLYTPSGTSAGSGSVDTTTDDDPFLSLLGQLAENNMACFDEHGGGVEFCMDG
ncbi:related to nitrate assimilation regulatory protein nirA [Ramularia collo-cygni]|uniref:Related to nitrate assimilation regulatory protein nirA n=1 Tax=Ramularia collo-cygni TaxID=112498 RepID=A0A2D3VGD1_9PEZI|nr:related to nitrate assimilation regulatory protein nirA [Ramularia collo-cygni]CZT20939.1 related to nitrate assimilation regulatory protein nirA [Ramularia collo-cygni]